MTELITDEKFRQLLIPLTNDEIEKLRSDIVANGCLDTIKVWCGMIVDGHHRYDICQEYGIEFKIQEMEFADRDEALVWALQNQLARRNLNNFQRAETALKIKDIVAKKAKEKQTTHTKQGYQKSDKAVHTLPEIAKSASVSHDTIHKVETILEEAKPEIKEQARAGEISINKAYATVRREQKRKKIIAKLENIKIKEIKEIEGVYDVIVIDPPWQMKKIERDVRPNQVEFDYPTMTEEELKTLIIPTAEDCHVWIWTTHKHLPMAFRLLDTWGLRYICIFVWHKPGGFQPIGLPQFNCEFILYTRKGMPQFIDTKGFSTCFNAERHGHSVKPEEFYEIVKRVTAGRRLDMFGRREINGFDSWGREATIEKRVEKWI